MDWDVYYIIGNILERRCLNGARITHLSISNTSYGQKKGWESNWQFNSRPLKVRNPPDFLACKWRATYYWKTLDKGYKFSSNFISIEGLQTKWWAPKLQESQLWELRDSHLGVSEQKVTWVLVLWSSTKYTIRGRW